MSLDQDKGQGQGQGSGSDRLGLSRLVGGSVEVEAVGLVVSWVIESGI